MSMSRKSPTTRRSCRHRLPVAVFEVVEDGNVVSARDELANGVRADVSGPAGNEDSHSVQYSVFGRKPPPLPRVQVMEAAFVGYTTF